MKHIINGHDKPLGGYVRHYGGRDEVQQRGCIHTHYVLCVEGLQHLTNDYTYKEALSLVKSSVIAMLIYDTREFTYLPDKSDLCDKDPRLLRFDPDLDYELEHLYPRDPAVRRLVSDLQLCDAYMHTCRESCFKYCKNKRKCRYGYPFSNSFSNPELISWSHPYECNEIYINQNTVLIGYTMRGAACQAMPRLTHDSRVTVCSTC